MAPTSAEFAEPSAPRHRPLFRWTAASIAACAAALVARGAWSDIGDSAINDSESGQILAAPIAFIWLLLSRRGASAFRWPGDSLVGPALVAIGVASWTFGYYTGHDLLWHGGAISMSLGAALCVLPCGSLSKYWPAWVSLIFAMPVSGVARMYFSGPLQRATAAITEFLCELVGMDVQRFGNVIQINGRDVAIAEACNGLRMVWPLILTTYVVAFARPMRPMARLALILASPVVAVIANVVRLAPTVWVYGRFSPEFASEFHDVSGWIMLIVAFIALFMLAGLWSNKYSGIERETQPDERANRFLATPVLTAIALLGVGLWISIRMPKPADSYSYHALVRSAENLAPMNIGDWSGQNVPPMTGLDETLLPNLVISRRYDNKATHRQASVLLVQLKDPRALQWHNPMLCYPANGWRKQSVLKRVWSILGRSIPSSEYEFTRGGFSEFATLTVIDVMLVPDSGPTADVLDVNMAGANAVRRIYGAAHLQIVFDARIPAEVRDSATQELLAGYLPLIDLITSRGSDKTK